MPKLSDDSQTVTISNVPLPLLEAIKQLAEEERRPVSNFLRQHLERIVAEYRAKEVLRNRWKTGQNTSESGGRNIGIISGNTAANGGRRRGGLNTYASGMKHTRVTTKNIGKRTRKIATNTTVYGGVKIELLLLFISRPIAKNVVSSQEIGHSQIATRGLFTKKSITPFKPENWQDNPVKFAVNPKLTVTMPITQSHWK
jgi:hypothetical protein